MNNTLYTCINKYNFNFSKMITDTKLKLSTYTNICASYPKVYYTFCSLKFCNLYMFKICRHILILSIFSKIIIDTSLIF